MSTEVEAPRAALSVPPALVALLAPELAMERQARQGRVRLAFVIACACALLFGLAKAGRVDSTAPTLRRMEQAGQLQTASDRQVEDEVRSANRLFQVGAVATALLEAPLQLGLLSLAVLALGWFLRGKLKGKAVVPVAAAALLPGAIGNLLDALSAWRQPWIPPQGAVFSPRNLSLVFATFGHPLSPPWLKLGNAFDFFSLWAAVLLGYGVAAAGEIPARRALWGTLVGWVCLRLLTNVAAGG